MNLNRRTKFYYLSFLKHDLKASITVFFVALPLCLGISLASNTNVYSGLLAGIIGGLIVSTISKSELSVSGPAAGLTAISANAISSLGSIELFFIAITIAGILQIILGLIRAGGFTYFVPSAVIKGMLTAIGIILVSKQIPLLIGYNKPDFWTNELFNIITLHHGFENIHNLYDSSSSGAVLLSFISFVFLIVWKKYFAKKIPFLPASFLIVLLGISVTQLFGHINLNIGINSSQFVSVPEHFFSQLHLTDLSLAFTNKKIWETAILICFVASLETLLSAEAIDKIDPYNRITPQNLELIAQGTGNFISGMLGGLPITAVIVRSSANAEAGARTKSSSFTHGIWLLIALLFLVPVINMIPYAVLAVILTRTGLNLAKPSMIKAVLKQGREQFIPFLITIIAVLFTDLLIGVIIGFLFAIYFLIKHTYRAGYSLQENLEGHSKHFVIKLALNVSFLNKKKFRDLLDTMPEYCVVEIIGTDSVYIDNDILEIFHDFKAKALRKHIQLILTQIPEVQTIELH